VEVLEYAVKHGYAELADKAAHSALIGYGRKGIDRRFALGRYVIMPDHIHLSVSGGDDFDLGIWIRGLKRVVAAAVSGGRSLNSPALSSAERSTTYSPSATPIRAAPSRGLKTPNGRFSRGKCESRSISMNERRAMFMI